MRSAKEEEKSTVKFDDLDLLLPRSQVDDGIFGLCLCIQVQGRDHNNIKLASEGHLIFFFFLFCS